MGAQNTHWFFFPLSQYSHNGHIKSCVLQTFKHFNMVDASIPFLNGDSFKAVPTNRLLFQQALCASITYFKNIFMGFK
jgi:hypothetical protein